MMNWFKANKQNWIDSKQINKDFTFEINYEKDIAC